MENPPNVLFILSDQQRWDSVDCYGRPIFPGLTPNLDRMASDGVMFRHTFTCQPVCGPARSCLQTGQFATRTGCFTNWRGLPADSRTIAHGMKDAGYDTAYIGKWHLAGHWEDYVASGVATAPVPIEQRGGYEDYWLAAEALEFTSHGYEGYLFDGDNNRVDFEGYRPDRQTDFALAYLRDHQATAAETPFFLFLSYIEPHHQNDLNRYIGPIGSKERFKEYTVPGDLAGHQGFWEKQLPDYLGCCWSLDQNVGRIFDALDELGIRDNTLVIYTSDHGDHFGTRNDESKRSPHDSSIRVPFLAEGPGFRGGRVIEEMVSLIDLPPTVLAAGGADVPGAMDGRPVQDLVDGTAADWPEEAFIQISETGVGRAIRTRRWKYAVLAPHGDGREDSGSDRYVESELYDLDRDPHEWDNRVADASLAEVRQDLAARLVERMKQAAEPEPEIEPAT
jgi:arylsulfatase A-like enzyme